MTGSWIASTTDSMSLQPLIERSSGGVTHDHSTYSME